MKNKIIENEKNNVLSIMTSNGLEEIKISNLNDLDLDNILVKLNRTKESILDLSEGKSLRWINDYAIVVLLNIIYNEYKEINIIFNEYKKINNTEISKQNNNVVIDNNISTVNNNVHKRIGSEHEQISFQL